MNADFNGARKSLCNALASLEKGGGTANAVTEGLKTDNKMNPPCHFVTFPLYNGGLFFGTDESVPYGVLSKTDDIFYTARKNRRPP